MRKKVIYPIDVLTSSNRFPEREKSEECTSLVRQNAADTAERVTKLLEDIDYATYVTSGFRTRQSNKKAKGAIFSAHLQGRAVDLFDPDGKLANKILAKPQVLVDYDLYLENPQYTKGWVHLDTTKRKNRIFIP